ncbi:MAG: hypothetical protein H7222_08540 [Methylotenera sp.]|nr:hypothetical protein [Oligoflexia bacterium]
MKAMTKPKKMPKLRLAPRLGLFVLFSCLLAPLSQLGSLRPAAAEESIPSSLLKKSPPWQRSMQELYVTLVDIMTDVTSEKRFNHPSSKARIDRNAKKLATLAHDINEKKMTAPDSDPTLKLVSGLFKDQADQAYSALKAGQRPYARSILSNISSYCIACHTRNGSGPSFKNLPLIPSSTDLTPFEMGAFYAATRQNDQALATYRKLIGDPNSLSRATFEWERSLKSALAITVRVKNDPELTLSLVNQVLGSKNAPYFILQDALQWKKSVENWKSELPHHATSEEGLFAEARKLFAGAHEMQKYPADHSADIDYLRASAVLHELLQKYPLGSHVNEALLLLGASYEVLDPVHLYNLHEIYYQTCVKRAPHTPVAETCYKRYEESVYLGYTGSAGTSIPHSVQEQLKALRELAVSPVQVEPGLK